MKVRDRFDKNRIGDLVCDGAYKYVQNFAVEIDGKRVAEYDSLDGVVEEWEDYKPAEPLIKDEKIRKAVRAWWDCCQEGIEDKRIYIKDAEFRMGIYRLDLGRYYFFDDKKEGFYTITELCGEEEE